MLPTNDELARARKDPARMLEVAGAYAEELQYTEALDWYETYLRQCPKDKKIRQAMRDLEKTRADQDRLRDAYEFADKCNLRLRLVDAALTESLQLLHRAVGRGNFQEAEERAQQVQQHLEAAIRQHWHLGEGDDLWGEAAHRASVAGFYDFAIELLQRSPRHNQEVEIYEAIGQASILLECAELYSKRGGLKDAEKLRQAILQRDLDTLNRALDAAFDWDFEDDSGEDDQPGSGVPVNPRPPRWDGQAHREWDQRD